MGRTKTYRGEAIQGDDPNWEPPLETVGHRVVGSMQTAMRSRTNRQIATDRLPRWTRSSRCSRRSLGSQE